MTNPMAPGTLARRIREYQGFGIHRTGWPGDVKSADWAKSLLEAGGVDAEIEEFEFPKFETRTASLAWNGTPVDGVPLHDCGFTAPSGLSGTLATSDASELRGRIVVAAHENPGYDQRGVYERIAELEDAGAAGLVLLRCDSMGAITVLNAYRIQAPFRLPVLQVACEDATGLLEAAAAEESGVLTVDAARTPSTARNVVATIPGEDPGARPVAIMTPRSGWFICASERGGGIAIWLGLAEAIAAMSGRRRTVHMVASSGHEINHFGLQAFLAKREGLETRALGWLHLGALIGSRATSVKIEPSDAELEELARASFESSGAERWMMWNQRGGEAENIAEAGGRYISLRGGPSDNGGDTFFHSPNDSFDRASDIDLVAASGRACLQIVETLISS